MPRIKGHGLTMVWMNTGSEAELISACRRGDSSAWDELFDRHYGATARFVFQLGYGFTPEDVEEICQETFLSVIRKLNTFRANSQFQTWVFRIAMNKARDYRQKHAAAKRGGGQVNVPLSGGNGRPDLPLDIPSTAPTPEWELITAEDCMLLERALDRLDDSSRELVELRYFGGSSYKDIADTLDLNPKTVGSRLSRCLEKLERIYVTLNEEMRVQA